ncbi:MAG TPA: hypothetical protein VFM02_03595, partial [Candidatus Paceibacterota bacterium]|nr:hypothetical protein [Candidatus Paceibacterota bacterium]
MNLQVFWSIWILGIALVILQGFFAYRDGYFTQRQMRCTHGIVSGWAFIEHGGMWADVFIVSPLVAFIVSRYDFNYTAWYSWVLLIADIALSIFAGRAYAEAGKKTPEAHTHHGKTTVAGWIHGFFAVVGIWIVALFFLTPARPPVSVTDLLIVAGILTPFFVLGIMKFNRRWFQNFANDKFGQYLNLILTSAVWI